MSPDNRDRLIALIAAGTRLAAAEALIKEALIDVTRSGLLPTEYLVEILKDIDAYGKRLVSAIELTQC